MSDAPPPTPSGPFPSTPYAAPAYAPPTNTLAILALVFAFVVAPAGIVCGHIALGQIARTGERGRELATAGLILGYVFTGLVVLILVLYVVMMIVMFGVMGAMFGTVASTT